MTEGEALQEVVVAVVVHPRKDPRKDRHQETQEEGNDVQMLEWKLKPMSVEFVQSAIPAHHCWYHRCDDLIRTL